MTTAYQILIALLAATLGVYGAVCAWHMHAYIGTPYYWTNQWFWKGHATLIVLIMLNLVIPRKPK